MKQTTAQSKGEAAYRNADAQLGVPAPRVRKGWRGWPVIRWVLNGDTLAARNDGEAGHDVVEAASEPPPRPVAGIVPKMGLGDYEEHKNDDPAN